MTYALREGVSFCAVEDRTLFLDLPADRYFCLAPGPEQSFGRLYRGADLGPVDRERIASLAKAGLLVARPGASAITPCAPPAAATRSLADENGGRPAVRDLAAALAHLARAPLELRAGGFAGAIERVRRRKARIEDTITPVCVSAVAAAFAACAKLASGHDRCLPRSLAVAQRLMRLRGRADLVIGVKLAPFRAHAWVQWRDLLVNEQADVTRLFTPILVV
jgi:hypothetical protein